VIHNPSELSTALATLRGAVLLAFPSGLPHNDTVHLIITGQAATPLAVDKNNAALWFETVFFLKMKKDGWIVIGRLGD